MTDIKEALKDFNPWWRGEFKIDFREREIYKKIQKFISLPQIIAFTGLRRVGKTTLMFKIVEDSINKGFDPKNIIYFSFDEFKEIKIREVIKEYEELMEKDIRKGKYLLLLDEIQKLNNWEEQTKVVYDMFRNFSQTEEICIIESYPLLVGNIYCQFTDLFIWRDKLKFHLQ
ncbi:AAA family ATPase [Candidatus Aminicenantes bacterium AC-334-E05]|nr:AAA family ATPase [Candidatus Aminicenantes bacterium AC-334-E05]